MHKYFGSKLEEPTTSLRWYQTHDLNNLVGMMLQQQWVITTYGLDSVPMSRETEWRSVPVVDGGLKI